MTRDEAIKIMKSTADWIDRLAKLGVLKPEEPKSRMTIFCEEIGWPEGGRSYQELFFALDKAGLKIVEK